jgi:hypothetical protein
LITTLAEATDSHPAAVTVNVYDPGERVIVVLEPLPGIFPGFIVHEPAGRPFKVTVPVPTVHVGCTTNPIDGAFGVVVGAAFPLAAAL